MVEIHVADETTGLAGPSPVSLSGIERDTIGEILNISMGAAATAVATLLDREVSITTPKVDIVKTVDLNLEDVSPFIGIEIEYCEGLSGSNLLVMKRSDVRVIVNIMLGMEEGDDSEEFNEIEISAVSEIMNQMMGASSTALASFFGKSINISTPIQFDPKEVSAKVQNGTNQHVVSVHFSLKVGEIINSEFVTLMPVDFTKELVENALNFGGEEEAPAPAKEPEAKPAAQPQKAEPAERPKNKETPSSERYVAAPTTKKQPTVSVQMMELESFDDDEPEEAGHADGQGNFDLILGVPLDVSVVIGRTKMSVKNILDIRQGSLVELDRQAGEPVDVIVNGQLIARGDVVIIDDNFGVRITEILSGKELNTKLSR